MARTSGPSSMLDMRSVSILFENDFAKLDGATTKLHFRRDIGSLPLRDPDSFDSSGSWSLLICAVGLGILSLGILHSCAFLGTFAPPSYELSVLQTTLISAGMYAAFIIFSPLGCFLVKSWGPQLTGRCGLLLGFVGLTVTALQLHWIAHMVANILFVGIGASFVQTASCCCVVDYFQKYISVAMILLSLISPVGSMLFISFSYFVGIRGLLAYKWIMLCYAMLFVAGIGITRRLPPTIRIPGHQDSIRAEEVAQKIKDCLKFPPKGNQRRNTTIDPILFPGQESGRSGTNQKSFGEVACTCACVVDFGIMKDISFFLWGGICFCAMLTFYVPIILLVPYIQFEFHYGYLDGLRFICLSSAASILSRVAVFFLNDFTFTSTKLFLQAGLLGNALIYFAFEKAVTYGWLLAVCFGLGITEGVFVILIPRLTFLIFPSKHLAPAWQFLMLFHAFGVIIGPTLIVILGRLYGGDIFLPCLILGVFQLIGAVFTFLLPEANEGVKLDERKSDAASP